MKRLLSITSYIRSRQRATNRTSKRGLVLFLGNSRTAEEAGEVAGSSSRKRTAVTENTGRLSAGFTLVEILVIVGVIALLLTLTLVYTNTGGQQIILFREQARFVAALSQARSSTLERVQGAERICGYGVSLQSGNYVVYRIPSSSGSCNHFEYTDSDEVIDKVSIDPNVQLQGVGASDIFFAPPEPKVYFDGSLASGEAQINFTLRNGNNTRVTINQGGQIVGQ